MSNSRGIGFSTSTELEEGKSHQFKTPMGQSKETGNLQSLHCGLRGGRHVVASEVGRR